MATKTTTYELTKPASTDYYSIDVQNNNMDIIDSQLKAEQDAISRVNENLLHLAVVSTGFISVTANTSKIYTVNLSVYPNIKGVIPVLVGVNGTNDYLCKYSFNSDALTIYANVTQGYSFALYIFY